MVDDERDRRKSCEPGSIPKLSWVREHETRRSIHAELDYMNGAKHCSSRRWIVLQNQWFAYSRYHCLTTNPYYVCCIVELKTRISKQLNYFILEMFWWPTWPKNIFKCINQIMIVHDLSQSQYTKKTLHQPISPLLFFCPSALLAYSPIWNKEIRLFWLGGKSL